MESQPYLVTFPVDKEPWISPPLKRWICLLGHFLEYGHAQYSIGSGVRYHHLESGQGLPMNYTTIMFNKNIYLTKITRKNPNHKYFMVYYTVNILYESRDIRKKMTIWISLTLFSWSQQMEVDPMRPPKASLPQSEEIISSIWSRNNLKNGTLAPWAMPLSSSTYWGNNLLTPFKVDS